MLLDLVEPLIIWAIKQFFLSGYVDALTSVLANTRRWLRLWLLATFIRGDENLVEEYVAFKQCNHETPYKASVPFLYHLKMSEK